MFKWLCVFLLLNTQIFSEEKPKELEKIEGHSVLEGEPTVKLSNINVITGRCCTKEVDFITPGPVPIVVQRFNDDIEYKRNNLHNWHQFQYTKLIRQSSIFVDEETGGEIVFSKAHPDSTMTLRKERWRFGIVNTGAGEISGKTNRKNEYVKLEKNRVIRIKGDGSKMVYYRPHNAVWGSDIYALEYEVRPSGHKVFYEVSPKQFGYHTHHMILRKMWTTNPSGDKIFSTVTFEYNKRKGFDFWLERVLSDSGKVVHHFDAKLKYNLHHLTKVTGRDGPDVTYEYNSSYLYLRKYIYPQGWFVESVYYHDKDHLGPFPRRQPRPGYSEYGTSDKVAVQRAPLGVDDSPVDIARFYYFAKLGKDKKLKEGYTEVFDALGHQTVYHYDRNRRIDSIERMNADGSLNHIEKMVWGEKDTPDETNLLCRSWIVDGKEISKRTFVYDANGNVLEEQMWSEKQNGSVTKRYTYSDDGFNNRLSEEDVNGVMTVWTYLPETNLPTSKLMVIEPIAKLPGPEKLMILSQFAGAASAPCPTAEHILQVSRARRWGGKMAQKGDFAGPGSFAIGSTGEAICLREFYEYDRDNLLIKTIVDDGKSSDKNDLEGVSERRLSLVFPKPSGPGIGQPECKEERYLDLQRGHEVLLKRVCFTYGADFLPDSETTYDANGTLCFKKIFKRNEKGQIIQETDAFGNTLEYAYDLCGNCVLQIGPRPDVQTRFIYDIANRLIRKEEHHLDGPVLIERFRYNALSQKIASIDAFGVEKTFDYDAFGHLVKTTVLDVSTEKKYDLWGRVIEEKDGNGFVVKTSYSIWGKPLSIEYPDGSKEAFEYTQDGSLKKAILKNGCTIEYQRDYQGRELAKETYDQEGVLLSKTESAYNAFHKISSRDPLGHLTLYGYDGAGRLSEIIADAEGIPSKTSYIYDALGEIQVTQNWVDDTHATAHISLHNPQRQVIEERVECEGKVEKKICYAYDPFGNKTSVICYNDLPCVTYTEYNSFNEPVCTTDPLGHKTIITYQRTSVFQKTVTDPLGNLLVTTYDAFGRIAKLERKSGLGVLCAKQELFYDGNGNKTCVLEKAIVCGKEERCIKTISEYGPMNRLERFIEAADTSEERSTRYAYDEAGQQVMKICADGTALFTTYDPFGHVAAQKGEGLAYTYFYDASGQLEEVRDEVAKTSTKRAYDSFGHLIEETLASGYTLTFAYNGAGQLERIRLPDLSSVEYTYSGEHIATVKRKENTCTYTKRDLSGHPLEIETPCGSIGYIYNALGKRVGTSSAAFHDEAFLDAAGNVIAYHSNDTNNYYTYDNLNQLTSENETTYLFDSLHNNTAHKVNSLNEIAAYTYDLRGNLIEKEGMHFSYDILNRLISITKEGCEPILYTYDAFNRRISKKAGDETLYFLYENQNEIGAMCDNTLVQFRALGEGLGAEVGASLFLELDGKNYIPFHDFRGSVVALMDPETQSIQASYSYTAFGECSSSGPISNPWQYSSKRLDEESGLIFFGRRYLDPVLGRFITCDPQGFIDGSNLYAFVHNNPLITTELYGLYSQFSFHMTLGSLLGGVRNIVGDTLRMVGQHLIPVPYLREGIMGLGHLITYGSFNHINSNPLQEHSSHDYIVGSPSEDSDTMGIWVNGICNFFDDAVIAAENFSTSMGGIPTILAHNSSHGLLLDVGEATLNKVGIPTNAVYGTVAALREAIRRVGSNGTVRAGAHSQGGAILCCALKLLTPEERKMIVVETYGSAIMIPSNLAREVINYVNIHDLVPWTDPIGYICGIFNLGINMKFIGSSRDVPLASHMITHPTYVAQMNVRGQFFKE